MGVKVCPLLVGRLGGEGRVVLDMVSNAAEWVELGCGVVFGKFDNCQLGN